MCVLKLHPAEEVARLYDHEIAVRIEGGNPCPRGGTCECPRARKLMDATKWEVPVPKCSENECPVIIIHERAALL